MPTFLHTADWQIGRQFTTLDAENAPLLAEARFAAVERMARLASEWRVDAVLVAGGVFDAQTVSDRTVRRLFLAMAAFTGPWCLIPGNHDAALPESVWSRAVRLHAVPPNVHLLFQPEPFFLPELRVAVLPAPLTQRHTHEDLTAWFDRAVTPEGWLRIGLAHGGVQGLLAEGIDSANPIDPQRAQSARLDYLALGDWHGCKCIDARTWYAGTPEPDRFKDNGAGQALKVEVDHAPDAPVRVTPVPCGRYRWQAWDVTLQVSTDVDALVDRLDALGADDVVDLTVSGRVDLDMHQRLTGAWARAEARVRHLQVDRLRLQWSPTERELAELPTDGYLSDVVAELRDRGLGDTEEAHVARHALSLLAAELTA